MAQRFLLEVLHGSSQIQNGDLQDPWLVDMDWQIFLLILKERLVQHLINCRLVERLTRDFYMWDASIVGGFLYC